MNNVLFYIKNANKLNANMILYFKESCNWCYVSGRRISYLSYCHKHIINKRQSKCKILSFWNEIIVLTFEKCSPKYLCSLTHQISVTQFD